MPRQPRRFAAALTALALAACTTTPTPTGQLEGTAWRAETIDGRPAPDDQNRSTLRFFDRQLAGGSLGCNAYSTTYFTDSGLRFGGLAPTQKTCAAPVMEQEARFGAALTATRSSRRDSDGALLLIDTEGSIRARLLPMAP